MYPGATVTSQRDPQTAMILEIIAGLFGFLGIGHFYAGRTNVGLGLLIGWWVFLGIEVVLMAFVIGLCLLPLNLIVPIVSGMWVRNELLGQPTNIMGMNLGSIK
jgi:TM2 domain-containing membrane protein YozV